MPYAFTRDETISAAIPRIMDELIVRAREQLTDESAPIDERVHDARKRFKETRALLRLVRKSLGAHYSTENAWFRDAAHDLAAARDADAVLEALAKLQLPPHIRARARRALRARRPHDDADLAARIANVLEQLVVAQARVALWPAMDDAFDTIAPGLVRAYRAGRRAMHHSGMPDELHEWRKVVKEHWYHMQLLRDVWPPMMKAYASVLESLSRALGDHHDLHVLRQIVAQSPQEFGRPATALALLDAIDARQRALELEAMEIGRRVYAERPRRWLARMRNEWDVWRT
ncbi:MAG TPA: CHAD domain-containing protein [Thermoanaerobaculia bacterium]|nr:CHAD domain-containing protein [Thermoanaerobaculia bacterium]